MIRLPTKEQKDKALKSITAIPFSEKFAREITFKLASTQAKIEKEQRQSMVDSVPKIKLSGSLLGKREPIPTAFDLINITTPFEKKIKGTTVKFSPETDYSLGQLLLQDIPAAGNAIGSIPFDVEARDQFRRGLVTGSVVAKESLKRAFASVNERLIIHLTAREQQIASKISKQIRASANKDKELSQMMFKHGGLEVFDGKAFFEKIQDPNFVAQGLGMNIPNFLVALGVGSAASVAGAPTAVVGGLGFLTTSFLEGGAFLSETQDFNVNQNTAEKLALFVGVTNGILEMLPIMKLINRNPASKKIKSKILGLVTRRILSQIGAESSTESLQEIVSNAAAKVFDENRGILDNVAESAYFGGLLGGGTSLGVDSPSLSVKGLSVEDVSKKKPVDAIQKPTAGLKAVGLARQIDTITIKKKETTLLKDRLRLLARGAREGVRGTKKDITSAQTELVSIIKDSNLEAKDKAKFLTTIKNIKTTEQLADNIKKVEDRISQLFEVSQQKTIRKEIRKELASIKTAKGKPKGKLTPETQKALEKVKAITKLSVEQAETRYLNNLGSPKSSPEMAIENRILEMWAGIKGSSGLTNLLRQAQQVKSEGSTEFFRKQANAQADLERKKQFTVDRVTGGEGITPGRETTGASETRLKNALRTIGSTAVYDWHGKMGILDFNNSVEDKKLVKFFGTLEQDNAYKLNQLNFIDSVGEAVSQSYNIENKPIKITKQLSKLQEKIDLGDFKNTDGVTVNLTMTKDEIIKRWMEFQDSTLQESFEKGNKFTDKIVSAINKKMTDMDKAFAQAQFDIYKNLYDMVNPIYREMNGVDLPFNEFYSAIKREGFEEDTTVGFGSFVQEAIHRKSLSSNNFITRQKNTLPIAKQGSVETLQRYAKQINYYSAWVKKIRELDTIFNDPTVKEAIKQEFTPNFLHNIQENIQHLTTNGNRNASTWKIIDMARKGFTVGALAIKPAIAVKQLVSKLAYLEKVGPIDFTIGVIDFWRNPIKNWKILNAESILIKTRGTNMERDIKDASSSKEFTAFSRRQNWTNALLLNVKLGDKGAIVSGSWALRRMRLKQGVPLKEIINEYENFSSATQQSADISRLSAVQMGGSLFKLFTMFKSSQRQYFAKELNAVSSLLQKDGFKPKNLRRVARVLVIYHVILPVAFQYIANLGGWDEKDRKDYLRAGILGSFNGLFIAGDVIDSVIRSMLGMRVWPQEIPIVTITDDLIKITKALDLEDLSASDFVDALDAFGEASTIAGIPYKQSKNILGGLVDIKNGDIGNGIGLLLGWSPYVVGKSKEKSKKSIQELINARLKTSPKESSSSGRKTRTIRGVKVSF